MNYLEQELVGKGSIDDFLIEKGVPVDVIELSKKDIVEQREENKYYDFFEYGDYQHDVIKIPVKDIVESARATGGHNMSWHYLLNGLFFDKDYRLNYDKDRFSNIFEKFDNMTYEEIKDRYEKEPSHFNTFKFMKLLDEDGRIKYIQTNDGSHRIIVAKIIGIEYVYTNEILEITINKDKVTEHLEKKKLVDILEKKKLNVIDYIKRSNNLYVSDSDFVVIRGDTKKQDILLCDIFCVESTDLINHSKKEIKDNLRKLDIVLDYLKKIEIHLNNNNSNIYKYYPQFLINKMIKKIDQNQYYDKIVYLIPKSEEDIQIFNEDELYKLLNLYKSY